MALVFGLDLGIASLGWAVLDDAAEEVAAAGSWTFDAPENDKDRTPLNAIRRQHRGQRRVVRRRAERMDKMRRLLHHHGLLDEAGPDALRHRSGLDTWRLRAEGLARRLEPLEFALALGHIARHRGFRSNSKRDRGSNAPSDDKKMLAAMEATRGRLSQWRTVGEMMASDPDFGDRKRNRAGDYSRTLRRDDLEAEARALLAAQRRLGNAHASEALEAGYFKAAFFQRPLKDSEDKVGPCPYERGQRRTARRAPSFERFRFLTRLANLRLAHGGQEQQLTPEQAALAEAAFGKDAAFSYKALRRALDLDPSTGFAGVKWDDEKLDVVARTGNAAEGTKALRDALGDGGWRTMLTRPDLLDRAAEVITFRDDVDSIRNGLTEAGVDADVLRALMAAVDAGRFAQFRGAGHISALAARNLLPGLRTGLDYTEACKEIGYDHAARPFVSLDDVRNPVARKALGQALKQVRAMVRVYGRPDRIHVELARDLGHSAEKRKEITDGLKERTAKREKNRDELQELLARAVTDDELLRYELWKEQGNNCLYTGDHVEPLDLAAGSTRVQVDHILPWSRFCDDSFINKALVTAKANQDKRDRTPFEWFSADKAPAEWECFVLRVEGCRDMKRYKKRGHYLRQDASKEVEKRFCARNLNDTRYAARVLRHVLEDTYGKDGTTVLARPGALTAKLRRGWGLEGWKKDEAGKRRADDRHHALDAIILAATTESMVNRLTRAFQEAERRGTAREFGAVDQPWPGFREQVEAVLEKVFVARAERRRVPGALHEATIRQVRVRDGKDVVFERVAVEKLKLSDLERVKDKERNAGLVEALRVWIEADKPKDSPPRSPTLNGTEENPPIRKVRLATNDKVAVPMRGGTAERGEMARVDVFREVDAKGRTRFHMVPIYPHQVADPTLAKPPSHAIAQGKLEADWVPVLGFEFLFSIHQNSLIEVNKPEGEIIRGYFKGVDRDTAAIKIADHHSQIALRKGVGTKKLYSFRKLIVDRLGNVTEIERETRTWHGAACT